MPIIHKVQFIKVLLQLAEISIIKYKTRSIWIAKQIRNVVGDVWNLVKKNYKDKVGCNGFEYAF